MSDETGRPTKRGGATFGPTVSPGEAELKLRLLVENVHDVAIFLMDPDGIITSWNAAAEKMKGFSAEEAIGSHYRMLYLPEDAALGKPEEHLRLAREQGKFSEKGYRARKNSTPFWAQVIVTPLWDDRG
ncbi:MAG: Sensor protein, partial [Armatimonadetes bacterium]|nr:Sensor protein [Armatimonadota bacterium]